ncbi:VOC family protein [Pseudonocardia sp. TRM90224]|uniref:VOC family protein n=1 Tax=Pseudonocardia sp. TRM90224 TaxID=2812678 RepID=UPI001E37587F|nr:VOC family protein [Pseudonocardia sp. TRM90224]
MTSSAVRPTLLVIYTERLDACRDFYGSLGLVFVRERHGAGPVHFAAELPGGLVVELYPARGGRITGDLRLGFVVDRSVAGQLGPGEHLLSDPDGRKVHIGVS